MQQSLDTQVKLDEGAEVEYTGNAPLCERTDRIALLNQAPGVRLQSLQAEAYPLAFAVDIEHVDLHLVADLDHLSGMPDAHPA